MQTIKKRILELIERNYSGTVSELSHTLGVTKPNIQYHLLNLVREGTLEIIAAPALQDRSNDKRGRPEKHYRFSFSTRPNNYEELASALLNLALSVARKEQSLPVVLKDISQSFCSKSDTDLSFIKRIQYTLEQLDRLSYMPRWEVYKDGPHISLRNCPYTAIIDNFPELCQLDVYLLKHLTGLQWEQISRYQEFSGKTPACIFRVQTSRPAV